MSERDPNALGDVAAFYAERLAKASNASGPACCATPLLAPDYRKEALENLPQGVAESSFGCGDPLAFAGVEAGQTVLDLGCGAGLDLLLAAEKTGPDGRVIGVDASPEMLERARRNAAEAGHSNIELLQGAIEELPVESASVDWVISNCVINLSMDKPAAFREIARVLRPGGTMVISDLVAEPLPDWLQVHRDLYAACVSGAVTEDAYRGFASDAGLTDLKILGAFDYDKALVRRLIEDELPAAVDALAARLEMPSEAATALLAQELSGKIRSIKLFGRRR